MHIPKEPKKEKKSKSNKAIDSVRKSHNANNTDSDFSYSIKLKLFYIKNNFPNFLPPVSQNKTDSDFSQDDAFLLL